MNDGLYHHFSRVWCALDGATLDAGECGVVARGLFAEVGDFDLGAVDEVMAAVGMFVCAAEGAELALGTSTFAFDGAVVPTVALDGAVLPFGTSTFALDGALLLLGTSAFALDGALLPFGTSTLALDGAVLPLGTSTALDGATVDGFTDARGDLVEGARVRTLALGAATGFGVGAERVARDAVSTTLLSRSSELVFTLSSSGPLNDTEDDATLLALQKAMMKRRKRVRDILRLIYEGLLAEV